VKIYAWPHFFQTRGTVRYSEPILGIAIAFTKIEPQYRPRVGRPIARGRGKTARKAADCQIANRLVPGERGVSQGVAHSLAWKSNQKAMAQRSRRTEAQNGYLTCETVARADGPSPDGFAIFCS
jgi:hypothetical protein